MPEFTVITICFNAQNDIRATIESVLSQSFIDFEYLIIDGASTDSTVKIAKSYSPKFRQRGITYRIFSEPDKGIYDAMNKGARKAQGNWVIYMNSGDLFFRNDILEKTARFPGIDQYDVLYGDTVIKEYDLYKYMESRALDSITQKMPFVHQSVFTNLRVFQDHPFSEAYKICSDYELYLKLYFAHYRFHHLPFAISVFTEGGISTTSEQLLKREIIDIVSHQPEVSDTVVRMLSRYYRFESLQLKVIAGIKKCLPQKMIRYLRRKKLKRNGWTQSIDSLKEFSE